MIACSNCGLYQLNPQNMSVGACHSDPVPIVCPPMHWCRKWESPKATHIWVAECETILSIQKTVTQEATNGQ